MVAAFRQEEEEVPSSADKDEGSSDGEEERYGDFLVRTCFFIHTLQLIVNMIHKDVSVNRLLEKVKAIVKQFRRTSVATAETSPPLWTCANSQLCERMVQHISNGFMPSSGEEFCVPGC